MRQKRAVDLLRTAENERLARQVLADHDRHHLANRVRGWLGQRLEKWGTDLQRRYSTGDDPFTLSGGQPWRRSAG